MTRTTVMRPSPRCVRQRRQSQQSSSSDVLAFDRGLGHVLADTGWVELSTGSPRWLTTGQFLFLGTLCLIAWMPASARIER